jgi:hypothetical protein
VIRSPHPRTPWFAAVLLLSTAVPLACSSDDGATTRETGAVQIIGPQPEGGGGSVSAVGAGCTTRGATTKLAARTLEVQLDEYRITAPATAPAGVTRVLAKNFGSESHGVVLAKATSIDALPRKAGIVDVEALAAGTVLRIEPFAKNTICEGTFELTPGTYVVFCNDPATGTAKPHLDQGMVATITLT